MTEQLYLLVGEILEIAQYIEWNIALLVKQSQKENQDVDELFAQMQEMTMGQIIGIADKTGIFNENQLEQLRRILDKRNYLAHQFFKINDIVKHNDNSRFLQNKIRELNNILISFQNFNLWLSKQSV